MTMDNPVLTALLDRSRMMAQDWRQHLQTASSQKKLIDTFIRRWQENDDGVRPDGLFMPRNHVHWYESLEVYLLHYEDDAITNGLVSAIIQAFDTAKPDLNDGDVWFFDLTALTRYRGELSGKVLEALRRACVVVGKAVADTDDASLQYFARIYMRAAEAFVIDVSENELKDRAIRAGLADVPFDAPHLVLDWGLTADQILDINPDYRKQKKYIQNICEIFYDALRLFYEDGKTMQIKFQFDVWKEVYDYPTLLFAGGLPNRRRKESDRMISAILESCADRWSPLKGGWSPTPTRLTCQLDLLRSFRNLQIRDDERQEYVSGTEALDAIYEAA
ncbi:hypothetical protein [Tistrella mobilis]|uniref:hypothetical protein n=1 Tax=Tistrella mobilis TaxID=171437 RepID=UPI003557D781